MLLRLALVRLPVVPVAAEEEVVLNFSFTDLDENHVVWLENAVLHHRQAPERSDADATIRLTRKTWDQIITKETTLRSKVLSGEIDVDGSRLALIGFFSLLDDFAPEFPIVTP